MRIEGNADNGQWRWADRNALTSVKPEAKIGRETDGSTEEGKKVSLQTEQKSQKINPADEDTGTRVNLLA